MQNASPQHLAHDISRPHKITRVLIMAPYTISTVQRLDAPSTYFEKRDVCFSTIVLIVAVIPDLLTLELDNRTSANGVKIHQRKIPSLGQQLFTLATCLSPSSLITILPPSNLWLELMGYPKRKDRSTPPKSKSMSSSQNAAKSSDW